ncbi:glycosyl transferase, group 2 family protein [Vibrio sp. N418]|uniref:glycosyltransferase family 2 protein n=1 Tax=Vibrio sp. (strain N418) TaxID=701176 RepID=UPI00021C0A21|nr:glycosyltransferase family 2 protein [Vibrio sp. N418]EGU33631.1 glycosyl transferase, group 2 family protein [Vibrio sp. N418]
MTNKLVLDTKCNNFKKHEHIKSILVFDSCLDSKPTISIMIPTFKRPHLIKDTIYSAVNQRTNVKFEVVIIDNDADGEYEDELLNIISSYSNANIRYFKNEQNIGMFGNWNRCIELARGVDLTILNDDDILHKDFLNSAFKFLALDKMVCFERESFYKEIPDIESTGENKLKVRDVNVEDVISDRFYSASLAIMFNREKALFVGGYDDDKYPVSDFLFNLDYLRLYGQVEINKRLGFLRVDENESLNPTTMKAFINEQYRIKKNIVKKLCLNELACCLLLHLIKIQLIKKSSEYKNKSKDFSFSHKEFKTRHYITERVFSRSVVNRIIWMICKCA